MIAALQAIAVGVFRRKGGRRRSTWGSNLGDTDPWSEMYPRILVLAGNIRLKRSQWNEGATVLAPGRRLSLRPAGETLLCLRPVYLQVRGHHTYKGHQPLHAGPLTAICSYESLMAQLSWCRKHKKCKCWLCRHRTGGPGHGQHSGCNPCQQGRRAGAA